MDVTIRVSYVTDAEVTVPIMPHIEAQSERALRAALTQAVEQICSVYGIDFPQAPGQA